jgi:hypothetical protein
MTVIKLWEGFGPDKEVQFTPGGEIFILPPDLPADLYFEVMNLSQRAQSGEAITEEETFRAAYDRLLDLCRYKRPKLERVPCSLSQLVTGVATIYGSAAQEEEKAGPPPARRTSGGAARTGAKPKPKTRSRR